MSDVIFFTSSFATLRNLSAAIGYYLWMSLLETIFNHLLYYPNGMLPVRERCAGKFSVFISTLLQIWSTVRSKPHLVTHNISAEEFFKILIIGYLLRPLVWGTYNRLVAYYIQLISVCWYPQTVNHDWEVNRHHSFLCWLQKLLPNIMLYYMQIYLCWVRAMESWQSSRTLRSFQILIIMFSKTIGKILVGGH